MADFSDDELGLIFRSISDPADRRSIAIVCKQWLRVEGLTRTSLRLHCSHLLPKFIPRFPNLTSFHSSVPIDDSKIVCLASCCPYLQTLNLDRDPILPGKPQLEEGSPFQSDSRQTLNLNNNNVEKEEEEEEDITDVGLYAVAKWCRNLSTLSLRNRSRIGDVGVFALARFLRNLDCLDLSGCVSVTDQALLAVGWMGSIRSLCLRGCTLITDKGLAMLSFEPLSKNLRMLDLSDCDRISDLGIVSLSKMACLEELNLGGCGSGITELGGLAISRIETLKRLNLSRLSISDLTLVMVSGGCQYLLEVDITNCDNVTGYGICAFASHKSLEALVMAACENVSLDDVKHLVLGCPSLKRIALDGKLRSQMSVAWEEVFGIVCRLDWM